MKFSNLFFCFVVSITFCTAQTFPNFDFTDSDGVNYNLYSDFLDQDQAVLVKVFFVDCPPCNNIAKSIQEKYVKYGSGQDNVQFIELSTMTNDTDAKVKGYKDKHGITFPSAGADGGSVALANMFRDGSVGIWTGTPHFCLIKPDGSYENALIPNELDATIDAYLATIDDGGGDTTNISNTINVSLSNINNELPDGIAFKLISKSDTSLSYPLEITDGSISFSYPSESLPSIVDPAIIMESTAPAFARGLRVSDLVAIRKHILKLAVITDDKKLLVADVNGDTKIRVSDMVDLIKVILHLRDDFSNGAPSYIMYPALLDLPIGESQGMNFELNVEILKVGNVVD